MAKEKENNKKAAEAAVSTVENIYENLDAGMKATDESLPEAAKAELKKETDDRIKQQLKARFQQADYEVDSSLLNLRLQREKSKVAQVRIVFVDRMKRLLGGFVVTEEVIAHAAKAADDLFKIETVDAKAKTITIKDGDKSTTYKLGDKVPAVIDAVDFDKYKKELRTYISNKYGEVEKEYDNYNKKLENKYGNYWDYSWRW